MNARTPEFSIKRVDGRFVLWTRPSRVGVWSISHPMNETALARAIDEYLDAHGRRAA